MFWELSHQQLVAFLRREADPDTHQLIEKLRQNLPLYRNFFELLDALTAADAEKKNSSAEPTISEFEVIEKGLLEYFSHKFNPSTVQQFRSCLLLSPQFYKKLLIKLAQILPAEKPTPIPELCETAEKIRTDAELIEQIKIFYPPPSPGAISNHAPRKSTSGSSLSRIPTWMYSSAAAVLIALAISWLFFLQDDSRESIFAAYRWNLQPPYPALVLTLDNSVPLTRSPSAAVKADLEMYRQELNNLLFIAMKTYQQRNYLETIRTLNIGKTLADDLRLDLSRYDETHGKQQTTENLTRLLQNYYFYLGVSHLAHAAIGENSRGEAAQQQHPAMAIEMLIRAGKLSGTYGLDTDQREVFFLGLAYEMLGDRESAVTALEKITPDSQFYEESGKLLNLLRSD